MEIFTIRGSRRLPCSKGTGKQTYPYHCPYCSTFEEDRKECLEIGLDAYTTKPIKVKLLGIIEQFV